MGAQGVKLQFQIEWRTTVFTAILLPVLVFLGFWQLQRAEEKAQLAQAYEARGQMPPAQFAPQLARQSESNLRYLPVRLRGTYLPDSDILLDNRIQQGRFGYEVVSPFRTFGGEDVVLVNRGWIEGDRSRQILPTIPRPEGEVIVEATVYIPPGEPYLLADQVYEGQWPLRLQAIEFDKLTPLLSDKTGATVFPHLMRIQPDQPGALSVSWQVINVSPGKHQAYAVQWFSMAVALLLLFVFASSNLWQWIRNRDSK